MREFATMDQQLAREQMCTGCVCVCVLENFETNATYTENERNRDVLPLAPVQKGAAPEQRT